MALRKLIELIFKTRGAKEAEKKTKDVDSSLVKLGKTALKVGASMFAARGLIRGFKAMSDAAGKASRIDVMTTAFRNMGKELGFSENSLQKLRDATNDTMGDMDLLTMANNALLLGVAKSDDEMAQLFDTAQRLGKAMGQDTKFAVESLMVGMGRQSKLMLDNLGIIIDSEKAYKDMATSLKKTVSELTDAEKKQAFLTATMESAEEKVETLGEEEITTAELTEQLKVSFEQLSIELGEKANPLVERFTRNLIALTDATRDFIGEESIEDHLKNVPEALFGITLHVNQLTNALAGAQGVAAWREAQNSIDGVMVRYLEMARAATQAAEEQEEFNNLFEMADDVVPTELIKETVEQTKSYGYELAQANAQLSEWGETGGEALTALQQEFGAVNAVASQFGDNIAQAVIHGANLGDAMVASLKAIAAELVAKAATFAIMNMITGGSFGVAAKGVGEASGFMQFMLQGFTGQSPKLQGFTGQSPKVNVNISGGLISDSYVRNTLVPALSRVKTYG